MLFKVKQIARNPLESQLDEANYDSGDKKSHQLKKLQKNFETTILEDMVIKIAKIARIGLGEEGCRVFNRCMNSQGLIDNNLLGKKVFGIFAFCNIRSFTEVTEILQQKVVIFLNEIAEIVHTCATEHFGFINKNTGDAFILFWKFQEEDLEVNEKGE